MIVVIALVAVAAIGGGGWFAYSKLMANGSTDQDSDDDEPYEDEYDDDDSPDDDGDDGSADELSEPDESDIVDGEPLPGTAEYERLKYDRTFDTVTNDNGDSGAHSRDR